MIRFGARAVPRLFAVLTAVVGAVNLASSLTPELPARVSALEAFVPSELTLAAHAFVVPGGIALLVLAVFLARRRRRALWLTVGVLTAIGGLELLKGLDVEEALISWALAGLLVWGRAAFTVRHVAGSLGAAVVRVAVVLGAAALATTAGVVAALHWATPATVSMTTVAREVGDLLTFQPGALTFDDAFAWLPYGAGVSVGAAIVLAAWELFRPLRGGQEPATEQLRALTRRLVHAHGTDTLSAFKLRPDLPAFVASDGRAFVTYRVHTGVLLLAGDPVGAEDGIPALLCEIRDFAAERGLRVGGVAASAAFAELAREAGLAAMYLGDEAIVSTTDFSLDGRRIKKVRQAVNRLSREGYTTELRAVSSLAARELDALEAVSARWRDGAPELGFSMAMDELGGAHNADSVVIVARDGDARVRGFLHFVPAYGTPVMSLSAMRRDRDTPNGLTEFLIVRAIEALREDGIEELSLNFAAFARWVHAPESRLERVLGTVIGWSTPYFQFTTLYAFNAKFFPRWVPRYLLHEGPVAWPQTALAALCVEGQIPELTRLVGR